MKTIENTYQPAELRTLSPELGLFIITGSFEEVKQQQHIMAHDYRSVDVRPSSFDRVISGKTIRRLGLFGL